MSIKQFFSDNDNINVSISFLALVVSVWALIASIRTSRRFGKFHIKTKQIDHVCELIEELNKCKISILFCQNWPDSNSQWGYTLLYNIFEIGGFNVLSSDGFVIDDTFEDEQVLFDQNSNQIINVKRFVDHPLTPRLIADELLNLYTKKCTALVSDDNKNLQKFVLIKTGFFDENVVKENRINTVYYYNESETYTTWLNLKESSKKLKLSIGKWLNENGIDEHNIREDLVTYNNM